MLMSTRICSDGANDPPAVQTERCGRPPRVPRSNRQPQASRNSRWPTAGPTRPSTETATWPNDPSPTSSSSVFVRLLPPCPDQSVTRDRPLEVFDVEFSQDRGCKPGQQGWWVSPWLPASVAAAACCAASGWSPLRRHRRYGPARHAVTAALTHDSSKLFSNLPAWRQALFRVPCLAPRHVHATPR